MAAINLKRVGKTFADGTVAVAGVDLDIDEGEFVVLVGPSGCGKSTLLRMIAGLESISEGEILIGGEVVNGVAPRDRDIAMVFQNYALYPQMSVRQNIGFALEQRRMARTEINERVAEAARILDLADLLDRKPKQLSGGQRQRVAMGRAIVRHPQAFLLDEPLSNLDAKLRVQMRAELGRLHARLGVTTIHVTHDQIEAMTLGSRVAVLSRGALQQYDRPQALYHCPANVFVAGFIGSPAMNFLEGTVIAGDGGAMAKVGNSRISLPAGDAPLVPGRRVLIGIRPEHLGWRSIDGSSGRLRARVGLVEHLEPESYVVVSLTDGSVVVRSADEFGKEGERPADLASEDARVITLRVAAENVPQRDSDVELEFDTRRIHLFDPTTGDSLRREIPCKH